MNCHSSCSYNMVSFTISSPCEIYAHLHKHYLNETAKFSEFLSTYKNLLEN